MDVSFSILYCLCCRFQNNIDAFLLRIFIHIRKLQDLEHPPTFAILYISYTFFHKDIIHVKVLLVWIIYDHKIYTMYTIHWKGGGAIYWKSKFCSYYYRYILSEYLFEFIGILILHSNKNLLKVSQAEKFSYLHVSVSHKITLQCTMKQVLLTNGESGLR